MPAQFTQWVPHVDLVKKNYYFPKKREPVIVPQGSNVEAAWPSTFSAHEAFNIRWRHYHCSHLRDQAITTEIKERNLILEPPLTSTMSDVSQSGKNANRNRPRQRKNKKKVTQKEVDQVTKAVERRLVVRQSRSPYVAPLPRAPRESRNNYLNAKLAVLGTEDPQILRLMKSGLTQQGALWMLNALDPFPDSQRKHAGYPDINSSKSMLRTIREKVNISAPASVTGTDLWDVHIVFVPQISNTDYVLYQQIFGDGSCAQPGGLQLLGGGAVLIIKVPTGRDTFPSVVGEAFNITGLETQRIVFDRQLTGNMRLVSAGGELCNRSSALVDGGDATFYRYGQTQQLTQFQLALTSDDNPVGPYVGIGMRAPPNNVDGAIKIGNSCTWPARQGGYQVYVQNSVANPVKGFQNVTCIFKNIDADISTGIQTVGFGTQQGLNSMSGTRLPPTSAQVLTVPYDSSGMYLTGLPASATLTYTFHGVIEEFMSSYDDNIDACEMSPAYDEKAMKTYSQLAHSIPAAVPLDQNYKGEWVAKLLRFVSQIATPIGAALNAVVPGAGAVGLAITKGSNWAADKTDQIYGSNN